MRIREPGDRVSLIVGGLVKRFVFLPRSFSLRWLEAGEEGLRTRVWYIGEGESEGYLKQAYLGDSGLRRGRLPLRLLRGKIRESVSSGTLLFVEVDRLLARGVQPGGYLSYPWVRQRVDLRGGEYRRRRTEMEATVGRNVRKAPYTSRVVRDEESVARFHREFYLPYVSGRFGEAANPRTVRELKSAATGGFLLQVFHGDLWVAGALCRVKGTELTALAFGHVPADRFDLRRGALSVAYHFMFRWAEDHGMHWVDLLRSRPNAADGVYEHKRRWGARAERDPWPHTCIFIFPPEKPGMPAVLGTHLLWAGEGFVPLRDLFSHGQRTAAGGG